MLRKTTFLPQLLLLASRCATALLAPNEQAHLGVPDFRASPSPIQEETMAGSESVRQLYQNERDSAETHGIHSELLQRPEYPEHQLRITEPKLCDPTVQQYSGYLDIAADKHLFFWFFESRNSPSTDPLILWLNGGPGSSSAYGLLIELGPCSVTEKGQNTTRNPFSWNTNANIIFLDQPVNVGYSYADGNTGVNSSAIAAQDVYAFLQLFTSRFPKYSAAPFHIAGESYGGIYVPNIANVIHRRNKELAKANDSDTPPRTHINLASIILADGGPDPHNEFGSMADYLCNGPYVVFDPNGEECETMRTKTIPACQSFVKACAEDGTPAACRPAMQYCFSQLFENLEKPEYGINPYDARKKCNRSPDQDGPTCYREVGYVGIYLNQTEIKKALGVDPDLKYVTLSKSVFEGFAATGDGAKNSAVLLPELIDDGIRMLVYAGKADMFSNYIGQERWVEALQTKFTKEFERAQTLPWKVRGFGKPVGTVRSAGSVGNVTFVTIYEAGHLAPFDQPEAALDLITRWIANESLSN